MAKMTVSPPLIFKYHYHFRSKMCIFFFLVHLRRLISCNDLAPEPYGFIDAGEVKLSWTPAPLNTCLTLCRIRSLLGLRVWASHRTTFCQLERSQVHSGIVHICWGVTLRLTSFYPLRISSFLCSSSGRSGNPAALGEEDEARREPQWGWCRAQFSTHLFVWEEEVLYGTAAEFSVPGILFPSNIS